MHKSVTKASDEKRNHNAEVTSKVKLSFTPEFCGEQQQMGDEKEHRQIFTELCDVCIHVSLL